MSCKPRGSAQAVCGAECARAHKRRHGHKANCCARLLKLSCVCSSWRSWEETMGDLFALARAVKLPLLLRDVFLHPVQVCVACWISGGQSVLCVHLLMPQLCYQLQQLSGMPRPSCICRNSSPALACVQIADAKMAGAAGIMGVITAVTGRSTPVMSSYACSLGLDCPVEVRLPSFRCHELAVPAAVASCTASGSAHAFEVNVLISE